MGSDMNKRFFKTIFSIVLVFSLLFTQVNPVQASEPGNDVSDSDIQISNEYEKFAAEDIRIEVVSDNDIHVVEESADNPTPQEVYNSIIAMKAQYPEGMTYTNANPAGGYLFKGLTNIRMYGYGCAAFAFIMSDAAFGNLPATTIYDFNWDAIRVGDILRTDYNSHSVIVLEKHTNYVIVAEGNYGGQVHWGRKIDKNELADGFTYYQTRYKSAPDPDSNNFIPGKGNSTEDDDIVFTVTDVRPGTSKKLMVNNGYYKILVFGGIGSCGNTMYVMTQLTDIVKEYGLDHTELWAFDIQNNSDSTMKKYCDLYDVGSSMSVINGTDNWDNWRETYYYCREVADEWGLLDGGILYMPLVAFFDDEGNLLDLTVSTQYEDDLVYVMEDAGFFDYEDVAKQKVGPVEAFVGRLYTIALNREAEENGLKDWSGKLVGGTLTGSQVAGGIFFSEEFLNRNLSDEDYVETLYLVMIGRPSDAVGKADWVYKLKNGVSREGVFAGFTGSTEFDNICNSYGIKRGNYKPSQARDVNTGLTTFVSRLYTKALERDYEEQGLNYWCEQINSGKWSINDASTTGFFNSPEFINKNTTNDEYVTILYHTFFDREPDEAGYNDWMGRLSRGVSRNDVLQGFANSPEFANLKKSYGL